MTHALFSFDEENCMRAFAAGFFDGDGCACCSGDLRIDIPQTAKDRAILDFFCDMFGGNVSNVKPRENRAPSVRWYVYNDGALAFAKFVRPYVLKSRKKREIDTMIEGRPGFGAAIKAGRDDSDDYISLEDVRSRMTTAEIDAYAAGFFLADGSACVQSGTKAGAKVTFSQKEPAILFFFKEHFRVGNVSKKNEEHPERTRNFELYGDNAKSVAARIAPYMPIGSGKRQILEALQRMTRGDDAGVRELAKKYNGNKPSANSRAKNAKGCVSAHKVKGVVVGYYARFLGERRGFTKTKNSPEENRRLAEECLADMMRDNAEKSTEKEKNTFQSSG